MDADRFDGILRSLSQSPSRRAALRALAGAALGGALTPVLFDLTNASKKAKKCKGKEKVTICHKGQTIQVSACALKGHKKHGDKVGACPPAECTGETEPCGGQCVPPCATGSVRNPTTCGCCFETGEICDETGNTPCCNARQECRDLLGTSDPICCLNAEAPCSGITDTSCCAPLSCEEVNPGVFRCGN